MNNFQVHGAGLGFRRDLMSRLSESVPEQVAFMEVAPENWINIGGALGKKFKSFTERYPFVCHGLSLSIGSPAPLDEQLVKQIKSFIQEHDIRIYSEHLSYCSDYGHLYDLMPIPFTSDAVKYVAERVKRVQDILERKIALENISYYAAPSPELSEIEFINAVLEEADCELLLDVNNIYVNSINHKYDPIQFLKALPGERVAYVHIAGHFDEAPDLKVDTHGDAVKQDVWALLATAYQEFGVMPTLLERDFNFPPFEELVAEVDQIIEIQNRSINQGEQGVRAAS